MRRLFLVGLSSLALACGTGESDESSADASGTGSSGGGSSSPQPPRGSTSSVGSTSAAGTSASSGGESTAAVPPETSTSGGTTTNGEAGSSGESGPALPRGQWAVTEITYSEGGNSETLSMQDRAFCDATLGPDTLLLRYQQADGYTVWTVTTIPISASLGNTPLSQDFSGVYMNINEVSDAWQTYFDPSMAFGSLELTEASLQSGGVVAGVLTATLTSSDGSTTAEFSSTFYAEIP